MSLQIQRREREGIVIFDLDGRITVGDEAALLRDTLREAAAAGQFNVILNLARVDYIDSTGLGALVVCYTTLRKAGGKLKLMNLSRRVAPGPRTQPAVLVREGGGWVAAV